MSTLSRLFKTIPPRYVLAGISVVALAGLGFTGWHAFDRIAALEKKNARLESQLASSTSLLQDSIAEIESIFSEELGQERERLAALQSRLGDFQQEVGTISGNVSNLEKLTKTDSELLQKYSRVFFLNEHYAPEDVVEIPNELKYSEQRPRTVHAKVFPYLQSMLAAAKNSGVELYVYSAYRPFEEQEALNHQYTVVYGKGTANQFSASQGYSEHQLGTTVDLITTGIGGTLTGFENTDAYAWLLENAHRFGFILSYPEGNEHYVFEPWHWRFVGIELATHLHETGQQFYDLPQREIDEYLVKLFD